jgi:hypothetical protein
MVSAGSAGREAKMADWVIPVNVVESGTATMKLKIRCGCLFLKTQTSQRQRVCEERRSRTRGSYD